jgi:UDP-N-acetylmuramate dehydrogenase
VNWDALAGELRARMAGGVERDYPLARLTTYRLGGPAAVCVEPASASDLATLGAILRADGHSPATVPIMALGRGSNVVVSDEGWPGIVIRLGHAFSWIEPDGATGMCSGASTTLPLLANWAARRSLSGLEFAVAIPGSVGGGVMMNAGAHGGAVGDRLTSVLVFDLETLVLDDRPASGLGIGYRSTNLTSADVVLEARFELEPDDDAAIRARMDEYRRHRAATQPGAVQNAGSVFVNPEGDSAGRLVEGAGLKGFRVGGAAVSELHANFFVADPGARAQDVFDLVRAVHARVLETFGVDLQAEIRFVGRFEQPMSNSGRQKR